METPPVLYDPFGTVVRLVLQAGLVGVGAALTALLLIALAGGAPRPRRARRRDALAILLPAVAAVMIVDGWCRQTAQGDLYWRGRIGDLMWMSWSGTLFVYALVLVAALLVRSRARSPRST